LSISTQTAGNFSFHCIHGTDAIIKPKDIPSLVPIMIMRIKSTAFLYGKDFNDGDTLKIKKHTY
jgi:hypothetical protein